MLNGNIGKSIIVSYMIYGNIGYQLDSLSDLFIGRYQLMFPLHGSVFMINFNLVWLEKWI